MRARRSWSRSSLPAPVQERAPHWLASTQFALDKVQEGLASASKADVARVGKIAVAANVAMRLSEVGVSHMLWHLKMVTAQSRAVLR